MSVKRLAIRVAGRVQGVGFRYFVSSIGRNLGLRGYVRNEPDGAVWIEVEGEPADVDQFVRQVRQGPALARVDSCAVEDRAPADDLGPFAIAR